MDRPNAHERSSTHCTSSSEYLSTIASPDLIISTGPYPELNRDLLVVGDLTRDEYFSLFVETVKTGDIDIELVDDAIILTQSDSTRVGIAYQQKSDFLHQVAALHEGRLLTPVHTLWSVGPWLPEAFASDLATSIPLLIKDIELYENTSSLQHYPEKLKIGIIEYCENEIRQKSRTLAKSDIDELSRSFATNDIALAKIRMLHALDNVYFRGLKYINDTQQKLSKASRKEIEIILNGYC